jgi:hypothetical protein
MMLSADGTSGGGSPAQKEPFDCTSHGPLSYTRLWRQGDNQSAVSIKMDMCNGRNFLPCTLD